MCIYRFHVRDALGLVEDEEGVDLPDLFAVLKEALHSAREFLAEASALNGMQFEIADAAGRIVPRVPFQDLGPTDLVEHI
jgi:hypothetical protein